MRRDSIVLKNSSQLPSADALEFALIKSVPSFLFDKSSNNRWDEEDIYNRRINVNGDFIDMTYGLTTCMIFSFGWSYWVFISFIFIVFIVLLMLIKSAKIIAYIDLVMILIFASYELNLTGLFIFVLRYLLPLMLILITCNYVGRISFKRKSL